MFSSRITIEQAIGSSRTRSFVPFIAWAHRNFKLVMHILTALFFYCRSRPLQRLWQANTLLCRPEGHLCWLLTSEASCNKVVDNSRKVPNTNMNYYQTRSTATWQHPQVANDLSWHQERIFVLDKEKKTPLTLWSIVGDRWQRVARWSVQCYNVKVVRW